MVSALQPLLGILLSLVLIVVVHLLLGKIIELYVTITFLLDNMAGPNRIPPKPSKSRRIGRRSKKGTSYRRYLEEMASATTEASIPIYITHYASVLITTYMSNVGRTIMSQYEGTRVNNPPMPSKKRADDGYRATRAVKSAKKRQDKAVAKASQLLQMQLVAALRLAGINLSHRHPIGPCVLGPHAVM